MTKDLQSILNKDNFLELYKRKEYGIRTLEQYSFWFDCIEPKTLARVVGDITADGHLSVRLGIIQFISKNKRIIIEFNDRIRKLFRINPRIRRSPSNKFVWESIILKRALCKLLFLCGTPDGNKTLNKFKIPLWIMNGDKDTKKNYLKGLFNGEGSIYFQNNRRIRIQFGQYKELELTEDLKKFMKSIQNLLKQFGIKTTGLIKDKGTGKKKSKTIGLKFEIYGTKKNLKSVVNYKKHIGFDDNKKKQKLNNSIDKLLALQTKPR